MKIELLYITPDADNLIESAGRTCYQSQKRGDPADFVRKIIKAGHLSVIEHASATFRVSGISRACSHQLVRHRLCSFSQQSQRYVSESGFDYVIPPAVDTDNVSVAEYRDDMAYIQSIYDKWVSKGLKKEDARFFLPNACSTEIVVSANFRQWRHLLEERLSPHAQWEIREMAQKILSILLEKTCCFNDINEKYMEKKNE